MEKKNLNKDEYYLEAYEFACNYVSKLFKSFTCEDVKDVFHETHDEPVEPRIWGCVFRRIKNEGRIVFHGYQKCKSKKGHGHPSTVWISIEYSRKQQLNRKANGKQQTTLEFDG